MSKRDDHCWPKLSWWHTYENIFKSKNYVYQLWEGGLGKIWWKQPSRTKVLQAQEQTFPPAAARGEHYSDAHCPSEGSRGLRCSRYSTLQLVKDPMPEQVEMSWRKLQPKDSPKSEFFLAERKAANIGAGFLSGLMAP